MHCHYIFNGNAGAHLTNGIITFGMYCIFFLGGGIFIPAGSEINRCAQLNIINSALVGCTGTAGTTSVAVRRCGDETP